MSEKYTVLSPWSDAAVEEQVGLSPRLNTLNGKTIGLFANFKGHSVTVLDVIAEKIKESYPDVCFTSYQYPIETTEIMLDNNYAESFKEWATGCDGIIAGYGDDGSSTMYHGMNTAAAERLGIPCVSIDKVNVVMNAVRGAAYRMVPNLRCVTCDVPDLSLYNPSEKEGIVRANVEPIAGDVIRAMITPLTETEENPPEADTIKYAKATFSGTYEDINKQFYLLGFTNGTPIVPPTREAVDDMLRGTDLAPNTILGTLPPKQGIITVEKLAVNAVMAGCLPIFFPVVIAIAKAMADPKLSLVGWQCSVAGFAPMIIINGPVRHDIHLNCVDNVLSPYYIANTSIARAMALITLNIAGIRPSQEDRAYGGHEARGGVCFGENEEESPWEPYHVSEGFKPEDSTVTLVWFQNRSMIKGNNDPINNMKILCATDDIGYNPGATFILSHTFAKTLSNAGFSKQGALDYICEYARKPASEAPIAWLKNNNHLPETAPLPMDGSFSVRKYWNTKYLHIVVSTGGAMPRGCSMLGGGDHGGPITVKIELPQNWNSLVREFREYGDIHYV
ncbi:MAG: hypothetical protein LIO57_06485 [Oscillospiraceae bacterium]|nr:hypothetical protein [Oscillospiraceae bacterium]